MQLLYPHYLLFLPLGLVLLWWLKSQLGSNSGWDEMLDPKLKPFLLDAAEQESKGAKNYLWYVLAAFWAFATLLMAGPSFYKQDRPVSQQHHALVMLLDLSQSMLVNDVQPSRIDLARFKALDLLSTRKEGLTGLVVFAGDAFVVSPMTDDGKTIAAQIKAMGPELMPVQGSNLASGVKVAVNLLEQSGLSTGDLIAITDGAGDISAIKEQLSDYRGRYRLSILSVGTEDGAPIPVANGFLRDGAGQVILPKMSAQALSDLAYWADGEYQRARLGEADINALLAFWAKGGVQGWGESWHDEEVSLWANAGIWGVWLLVVAALLAFRRFSILVLVGVFGLGVGLSEPVEAGWSDWWRTKDQQGQEAFEQGDYDRAQQLFQRPEWQGAAAYQQGLFKQAEEAYSQNDSVLGQYNLGNALAQQGKFDGAIEAYERVLAQQPEHVNAAYNLELVKKAQQQQEQQGQQNQRGENQSGGEEESQQQSGQEDQSGNQESQQQVPETEEENNGQQNAQSQQKEQSALDSDESKAQNQEEEQALAQWLRRIDDDPGGLWRRKFKYQYQRRAQKPVEGDPW